MRQIVIPCEYDQFEKIADDLYSTVPFAIIDATYRKNLKKAFIFFWDAEYIPADLQKYITRPNKPTKEMNKNG
jgi:hypothetical protein